MKNVIAIMLMLVMISFAGKGYSYDANNAEDVTIDGCDYIFYNHKYFGDGGVGGLTHKGNCRACSNNNVTDTVVVTDTVYIKVVEQL